MLLRPAFRGGYTAAHQERFGGRTEHDSAWDFGKSDFDGSCSGEEFSASKGGAGGDGVFDGDKVYEAAVFVGEDAGGFDGAVLAKDAFEVLLGDALWDGGEPEGSGGLGGDVVLVGGVRGVVLLLLLLGMLVFVGERTGLLMGGFGLVLLLH